MLSCGGRGRHYRGKYIRRWMMSIRELPFGRRRQQHCGTEEVVYGSGCRLSVCCAVDTNVGLRRWMTAAENTATIGDAANAASVIIRVFNFSKLREVLEVARTLLFVVLDFGLPNSLCSNTRMKFTDDTYQVYWWLNAMAERAHQERDSRPCERPSNSR